MADKMSIKPISREELQEIVGELSSIRGRHTELVSVIVPAGANINVVIDQLESEKSTARNIKSSTTRKNVIEALERATRQLRQFGQSTPKNGIAIYSGNVSQVEGQEDMRIWTIVPPEELGMRLYRCDQVFIVEPLKEMLEVKELYGLFVIERKEATIGLLEGKKIKILQHIESGVPGKTRAGGQCLSLNTLIETKYGQKEIKDINIGDEIFAFDIKLRKPIYAKCLNKWKKNVGEYRRIVINNEFFWFVEASFDHTFFKKDKENIVKVSARDLNKRDILIVHSSEKVSEFEIIDLVNINKEIETFDLETEAGNFFANGILVHNSSQRYERIVEGKAKDFYRECADALKKQFFDMKNLKGIIIGGPMPTKDDFLKEGLLVTVLKNKVIGMKDIGDAGEHGIELLVEASADLLKEQEITLEKKLMEKFFEMLGKERKKTAYGYDEVKKALELASVDTLFLSRKLDKKIAKELQNKAEEGSAKVEFVSIDTEEGQQFYNLGGIGAILRFSLT